MQFGVQFFPDVMPQEKNYFREALDLAEEADRIGYTHIRIVEHYFHYYGGYTPEWYKYVAQKFRLQILELVPNGGFFRLLAQESARVAWTMQQHRHLHGENVEFIQHLFGEWIPRYLFALEEKCFIDQFTVGYHVEIIKQK